MDVDNVVYVSDLDSDSESDSDDKLIFLPDIEKRLNRIPYSLASDSSRLNNDQSTSTELVLYSIPSSISVPEQKDVVRRAMIESRERMLQKRKEKEYELTPPAVPNGGMKGMKGISCPLPSEVSDGMVANGGVMNQMPNEEASSGSTNGFVGGWDAWTLLDGAGSLDDLDAMEIE